MNSNYDESIQEQNVVLREEISELHNRNSMLVSEINRLNASYREMCETMQEIVGVITKLDERESDIESIVTMLDERESNIESIVNKHDKMNTLLYNRIRNLPYEIFDPRFKDKYAIPQIMTEEETIDEIVNNRKSIARFGDGEFGIMFGVSRWRFQKKDDKLAQRLREVVTSNEENIMIGINNFYGDLSHRTPSDAEGIRSYIVPEIREQHMQLLRTDRVYAHACISRTGSWEKVNNQRRIWDKKDCVFIEGDKTRMGVGNDLFDNAASIQRIICPAESAFDRYNDILEEALKIPKNKTILIALGPTASVLAYDLAKAGYHAIDIGHADISYEWFLRNGGAKTAVSNKYNNEWPDGYLVEDIMDPVYESQIIARFV